MDKTKITGPASDLPPDSTQAEAKPVPAPGPVLGSTNDCDSATKKDGAAQEIGGRIGPDPTRFGDWEKAGRCIDF